MTGRSDTGEGGRSEEDKAEEEVGVCEYDSLMRVKSKTRLRGRFADEKEEEEGNEKERQWEVLGK